MGLFTFQNRAKKLISAIEMNAYDTFVQLDPTETEWNKKHDFQDFKDFNLLHIACLCDRIEISKYLLEKEPELLHSVDEDGRTPLHLAIRQSNVELTAELLRRGANADYQTAESGVPTPVIMALQIKRPLDLIKMVLDNSPSVKKGLQSIDYTDEDTNINSFSSAALHYLFTTINGYQGGSEEIEPLLQDRLNLLKSYGFDFNVLDSTYNPVFFYAIELNLPKVLRFFLESGVNPNLSDHQGGTSCDYAVACGNMDIIPILLEFGGKFNTEEMRELYKVASGIGYSYKMIFENINDEQEKFLLELFDDCSWDRGLSVINSELSKINDDLIINFTSLKHASYISGFGYNKNSDSSISGENQDISESSLDDNNNIMYSFLGKSQFFSQLFLSNLGFENMSIYFIDNIGEKYIAKLSKYSDLQRV